MRRRRSQAPAIAGRPANARSPYALIDFSTGYAAASIFVTLIVLVLASTLPVTFTC